MRHKANDVIRKGGVVHSLSLLSCILSTSRCGSLRTASPWWRCLTPRGSPRHEDRFRSVRFGQPFNTLFKPKAVILVLLRSKVCSFGIPKFFNSSISSSSTVLFCERSRTSRLWCHFSTMTATLQNEALFVKYSCSSEEAGSLRNPSWLYVLGPLMSSIFRLRDAHKILSKNRSFL